MDSLKKTLELLEIEREEDRRNYREKFLETPLTERKKQGLTWYPIVVNNWETGLGERIVVEIERSDAGDSGQKRGNVFNSGAIVSLFSNADPNRKVAPSVNGVVISSKKDRLRIALNEEDLPDWIDEGKVGLDLSFDERSYKVMAQAMEAVVTAKANSRLAALREVLLGSQPAGFRTAGHPITLPALNPSQNEALNLVLNAEEIAIIHGPPGTGKTTTLVKAVQQTLKSEKQVLVCAPSNLAVDFLTEKFAKLGLKVLRLGHPARLSKTILSHSLDQQISSHESYSQLKSLRKEAEAIRRQALKFKRKFGQAERQERRQLLGEARNCNQQARKLEDYILHHLLDSAQVITCTLTGAATSLLKNRHFPTVFIDEAAQALEPACWIAINRADRVILAGDHCQLPPTVKSAKAARAGLMETLFEKAIQPKKEGVPSPAVLLRTQYRMHQQIMEFSSRQFYNAKLEADASVAKKALALKEASPADSKPLQFIDTAGCGFEEEKDPDTLSTSNPGEAGLCIKVLMPLLQKIDLGQMPKIKVGIISPYKAQVLLLRELLEEESIPPGIKINVDTVDGFQGQERDLILISLVRSNDKGEIGFLGDIRRMNVAMTRAKRKLIVVGDSATLGKHSFYQAFLDYVEETESYQSAWEYLY